MASIANGAVVGLFCGPDRLAPVDEAAVGRALDALADGSVAVVRDGGDMARVVAEQGAERGIHVATMRKSGEPSAVRAVLDEAAFSLQPDVVYAHRCGGEQTARVVRSARALGVEVRPLGAGKDCEWASITRTSAQAAGVATGAQSLVVLFSGSRMWRDLPQLEAALKALPRDAIVVEGDASGLDRFAGALARLMGLTVVTVPALWDFFGTPGKKGNPAGFRRNEAMLRLQPDRLQAFPLDGPGTAGMIRLAEEECVQVREPVGPHSAPSRALLVDCRKERYDQYIGRGRDPHTKELGGFGNRYSHFSSRVPGTIWVPNRETAVVYHRAELFRGMRTRRVSLASIAALHGKVLGCYCKETDPCHGETLDGAAMWALTESSRDLAGRVAEMVGRGEGE